MGTRGHVGREVLIKLDPADWQMEERQIISSCHDGYNLQHWNISREIVSQSPVNYYQSDDQLRYSNYIEIDD